MHTPPPAPELPPRIRYPWPPRQPTRATRMACECVCRGRGKTPAPRVGRGGWHAEATWHIPCRPAYAYCQPAPAAERCIISLMRSKATGSAVFAPRARARRSRAWAPMSLSRRSSGSGSSSSAVAQISSSSIWSIMTKHTCMAARGNGTAATAGLVITDTLRARVALFSANVTSHSKARARRDCGTC
jgi:hypothetical protein